MIYVQSILIIVILAVCSYQDLKEKQFYILPPIITGTLMFILRLCIQRCSIWALWSGVAVGLFLLIISKITKGKIGVGDGILVCITGITLDFWANLELLYIALVLAALFSVILLLLKKCNRKHCIPFVPFLFLSYIIQLVF